MPNGLVFFLLFAVAISHTLWQRARLKAILPGKEVDAEWFQGVFRTGGIMTLALVANAIPFLKSVGLEHELAIYEERIGSEPSMGSLWLSQLEVIAGTYFLIAIVWRAVLEQGKESAGRGRRGQVEVMAAISRRLLIPFWLAAIGIGSVFGVSATFDLTDVLQHAELLLGPPLLLAVELTIMWLFARSMLKYVDKSGQ